MQIKLVPGFTHIVATSDWTIYNIATWNKLVWWVDSRWYRIVDISWSSIPIHRLVCLAYHWESLLTVNHKDWNKKNNHFTNLEWISLKDNNLHALETGLNRRRPIRVIRIGTDYTMEYNSVADCSRDLNINKSAISHCLNWLYKQWKWYRFEEL